MQLVRDIETLAFDFASARSIDEDGRLHVSSSNISKANVCGYRGAEIPDWVGLGLDADKVYNLLRHPDELKKAVPTFNRLPILSEHVQVSADDHQPDLVVGATGSHAAFDGEHMQNGLVVWKKSSIDRIQDKSQRELSSAYRYRADMTPGSYQGQAYDGVMRDIRGNHVALVRKGRAGNTVVVGDEALAFRRFAHPCAALARKFV